MPDGLTAPSAPEHLDQAPTTKPSTNPVPAEPAATRSTRRTPWLVVPLQMAIVVALFAGAGALCGVLWRHLWTPPSGVVVDHRWFPDPVEAGLRAEFPGTAWYVVVALVAGLVLGAAAAYVFDRSELATLVAVGVGSALAAWLMLRVGLHLSPPDPDSLARTAEDGTRLSGALQVSRTPPKLAFPFGALLGLSVVYLLTSRRGGHGPAGEDRNED